MRRKSPTTVEELADRLDLEPQHVPLLRLALTHRSQADGTATDNERLEFLGDSILGMLANEYLYEQFPQATEGQLTRMKANVVSEASLARPARSLGLGQILDMTRSEEAAGGRDRSSTLADTFEAVLAAIYLNAGLDAARRFVREYLIPEVDVTRAWDYKSTLQELLQGRHRSGPVYRIISEAGPPHAKEFIAEVYLGEELLGTGRGGSKKQAEQVAAAEALAALEARLKKIRRSRKSAKRAAKKEVSVNGAAPAAPLEAEETLIAAPSSIESLPPPTVPAAEELPAVEEAPRPRRRSRKAAAEPAPESAEPPAAAQPEAVAGVAEVVEAPKRARRTTKRATSPEPAAVPEVAAEPAAPEDAPAPKPRRSRKSAAPEAVEELPAAEVASEAKQGRARSRKKAQSEET